MGVSDMEMTENKGFNVVERATVNANSNGWRPTLDVLYVNRFLDRSNNVLDMERKIVETLENKEIETEERIANSPLHLSLRELTYG